MEALEWRDEVEGRNEHRQRRTSQDETSKFEKEHKFFCKGCKGYAHAQRSLPLPANGKIPKLGPAGPEVLEPGVEVLLFCRRQILHADSIAHFLISTTQLAVDDQRANAMRAILPAPSETLLGSGPFDHF